MSEGLACPPPSSDPLEGLPPVPPALAAALEKAGWEAGTSGEMLDTLAQAGWAPVHLEGLTLHDLWPWSLVFCPAVVPDLVAVLEDIQQHDEALAAAWVNRRPTPHQPPPLLLALQFYPEAVRPLLLAGASLEDRNQENQTPLMVACQHAPSCVGLLLRAGANVHERTPQGWRALHSAATHHPELIPELVEAGALSGWMDSDQRLKLWWCTIKQPAALLHLLEAGLNPTELERVMGLERAMDAWYADRVLPETREAWRAWKTRQGLSATVAAPPTPSVARPRM